MILNIYSLKCAGAVMSATLMTFPTGVTPKVSASLFDSIHPAQPLFPTPRPVNLPTPIRPAIAEDRIAAPEAVFRDTTKMG
jgi:hypothetical protein